MDCQQLGQELAVEALMRKNQPTTPVRAAHLDNCAECRGLYEELRETVYYLSVLKWEGGLPGLPQQPLRESAAHPVARRSPHRSATSPDSARRCALTHRAEPSGVLRPHRP